MKRTGRESDRFLEETIQFDDFINWDGMEKRTILSGT
jgi:hypothetical protein